MAEGAFFLARAEDVMAELLAGYRHSVQLIYLDPPSGQRDSLSLKLGRGVRVMKLPVEDGPISTDTFPAFMRTILEGCHKLLSPTGSLYLHTEGCVSAQLRLLCDEIFGKANFQNEIIWSYKTGGRSTRYFPRRHDGILFYRKSRKAYFDITAVGKPRGAARTNHMKRFLDEDGRAGFSIRARGRLYKYYDDDLIYPSDVWTDIEPVKQASRERLGWASQKPEALLRRMLLTGSREGDLVLDLFCGSGTTAAACAALGRQWIAVDVSPLSLYTTRKRLLAQSSVPALGEKAAGSLTFSYPATRIAAALDAQKEGRHLIINKTKVGKGDHPLVYVATGIVENDCFVARHTNCAPLLPVKIQLPENQEAVVHLVNAAGEQVFLAIDN